VASIWADDERQFLLHASAVVIICARNHSKAEDEQKAADAKYVTRKGTQDKAPGSSHGLDQSVHGKDGISWKSNF
jgi:hypothetical protein